MKKVLFCQFLHFYDNDFRLIANVNGVECCTGFLDKNSKEIVNLDIDSISIEHLSHGINGLNIRLANLVGSKDWVKKSGFKPVSEYYEYSDSDIYGKFHVYQSIRCFGKQVGILEHCYNNADFKAWIYDELDISPFEFDILPDYFRKKYFNMWCLVMENNKNCD